MLKQDQIETIESSIRTTQIINFALLMGVVFFGIICFVIVPVENMNSGLTLLTAIGLVVALSTVMMSLVLPGFINAAAVQKDAQRFRDSGKKLVEKKDIQRFATQFQTTHIVRLALIEGGAFMNLVIFIVDHSVISLMVAGICVILLALGFPTYNRILAWLESYAEQVMDQKRAG